MDIKEPLDIYALEPLGREHGPAVMAIFNHYIQNSFSAYFDQTLTDDFFDRLINMTAGYPSFAARFSDGSLTGFAFLHPYHPAPAFKGTAEISYFISPDHTRRGLGKLFLDKLIEEAGKAEITNLVASVSSLNEESLTFHQKHGFYLSGRLKAIGRKFGRDFDVIYLTRPI